MNISKQISVIEKWTDQYEFTFQFWGDSGNSVFIHRANIEVASFGGEKSIEKILARTIEWLKKSNPDGVVKTTDVENYCCGCGTPIAKGNDFCGECLCEDDSDY